MYALALGSLIATKYPKGSDDGKLSDGRCSGGGYHASRLPHLSDGRCSGGGYHASRLPHPAARNASTIDTTRSTKKDCSSRSEERRVGKECRSRWSPAA